MPAFVDQVVGEQRQNRPEIKVLPVDDKGDKNRAAILGGWIRNVMNVSSGSVAIDHAFEHSVVCAYGAFRVVTHYTDDDSFEQDVSVDKIDNALSVWWGPHTRYDCSDAQYVFIITDMPREEYKDKYGDDAMPFNTADSQYVEGWCTKDTVRIAEYFVKEPVKKTIYLLSDGRVVDQLSEGDTEVQSRIVNGYKIMWYLITGNDVKEQKEWVGKKYIPVIPAWGKEINVGGKRVLRSLIRHGKDPQRMYNYWQSSDTELVALAPKFPYIVTPKQIENHEGQWREANRRNYAYLLVNPDQNAPGWPQRQTPPQVSTAMTTKITQADQEMRDTMGLQKASLGMQSNERSGKAILERKREGDVGTFAFIDNLTRSLEHLGRVLVDVSPHILDTQRIIRLGLMNGDVRNEAINVPAKSGSILNDMTIGKYDVVCKVGPSFATQRSEARQSMNEFIQYVPAAGPLIGDLFAESMDWPRAEEVAKRLEFLLPPEIRIAKALKEAEENGDGTPPPSQPPGALPPSLNQEQPDPMQALKIAEQQGNLKLLQIKVEQETVRLAQEKAKLEGILITNEAAYRPPTEVRQFTNITPGRAEGGPVERSEPYVVGEEGPEVFVPEQNGEIVSNDNMSGFDPQGDGYDYFTAIEAGLGPDDTGHWPSIDPRTGRLLKGMKHPTIDMTLKEEERLGNTITQGPDGYYYSTGGE
jgi:hypothetical protein